MALRATSAALDARLTALLTMLADTRAELIAVPSTRFAGRPRDVPYTELLAYASKISKFSQPPNSAAVKHMVELIAPHADDEPPAPHAAPKLPLGLSEEDLSALDPSNQMPVFMPWPSELVMRIGALAAVGPDGVPQDMVPEVDRRAEEEARAKAQQEDERRERGIGRHGGDGARGMAGGGAAGWRGVGSASRRTTVTTRNTPPHVTPRATGGTYVCTLCY